MREVIDMDSILKKMALKQAVELTQHAVDATVGGAQAIFSPEATVEYLDTLYKKLCTMHEDAEKND